MDATVKAENVQVTVRVRPLTQAEEKARQEAVWLADPDAREIRLTRDAKDKEKSEAKRAGGEYFFDEVFQGSDNTALYQKSVRKLVRYGLTKIYNYKHAKLVLSAQFNDGWAEWYVRLNHSFCRYLNADSKTGTVFAYGQTSSGKTYTMMGRSHAPGVIPQAVEDVFKYIRDSAGGREYLLRVSYIEIYNETVRDLLSPDTHDLRIHEDKKRGVYVSPLKEEIVTSPKQVMRVIQHGEANRHISTTDYNEHSSRSHTIFQMIIESRIVATTDNNNTTNNENTERSESLPSTKNNSIESLADLRRSFSSIENTQSLTVDTTRHNSPIRSIPGNSGKMVRVSLLNLIDLAGSEKAASNADRRKEGAYINKSLLTLGSVIAKLTEEKSSHIPYRDSKLTRILQSSLSGNARVCVICTISPALSNVEESSSTLKFAARVKRVVTRAKENEIIDDKALLQKYRLEIVELRDKLIQTNEAFELERKKEMRSMMTEREKYEEELHDQQMLRTALKERIDHLTRLILTSGSLSSKTLTIEATTSPPSRRVSQEFNTDKRMDVLNQELVQKEVLVQKAARTIESKDRYITQLEQIVQLVGKGDSMEAVAAFDVLVKSKDDVTAFSNLEFGENSLLSSQNVLRSISSLTEKDSEEIVRVKQTNRELEIVVLEQEEKIQQLEGQLMQQTQDHSRVIVNGPLDDEHIIQLELELGEHRDMLAYANKEVRELRQQVVELRGELEKREVQSFENLEAQTVQSDYTTTTTSIAENGHANIDHDLEARIKELDFMYENERKLRVEEQQRNKERVSSLTSELAITRAELSIAQLMSNIDTTTKYATTSTVTGGDG